MAGHLQLAHIIAGERRMESANRGLYHWDARLKLLLLLLAMALNIWLARPLLSAGVLGIGMALLLWSRPPGRQVLYFLLAPLWATLLVVCGYALAFGSTPFAHVAGLTLYREGLLQGGYVFLRAFCDITWLALTFLTTPFGQVLQAMRWYRVPEILVDTLAMMYRYAFLLFAEFGRMRAAAQSRGGRSSRWREMQSLGRICAQIFMRAFDRSERIYWATFARGGE